MTTTINVANPGTTWYVMVSVPFPPHGAKAVISKISAVLQVYDWKLDKDNLPLWVFKDIGFRWHGFHLLPEGKTPGQAHEELQAAVDKHVGSLKVSTWWKEWARWDQEFPPKTP